MNQRVWKFPKEFVIRRLPRQSNGIALRLRAVSPTIEYGQNNRFRSFAHSASEYTDFAVPRRCRLAILRFGYSYCFSIDGADAADWGICEFGSRLVASP